MRSLCFILIVVMVVTMDAWGQQAEPAARRHMVIMIKQTSVYTDMGQQNGIVFGAVLDVYRETAPIKHPTTGEILGNFPILIGKLQITQVFEKYSIGKVITWSAPEGIRQKDLISVSKFRTGAVTYTTSRFRLLVPGLYQFGQGMEGRGAFFLGSVLGLVGTGTYFKFKSRSAHRDYLALPAGAAQDEFDASFDRYRSNGKRADILLMAAGGLYLANMLDGLLRHPTTEIPQSQRWMLAFQRDQFLVHFAF